MGANSTNSIDFGAYDLVLMIMSKNYAKMVSSDLSLMSEDVIKNCASLGSVSIR